MMTPDDPRLTAYVLGELDDAEKAKVEAALEESPACREEVSRIRQMSELLSEGLACEGASKLTPDQKAEIQSELADADGSSEGSRIITWQRAGGILAAAAVVSLLLVVWQGAEPNSGAPVSEMARQNEPGRDDSFFFDSVTRTSPSPSGASPSAGSRLAEPSSPASSSSSAPAQSFRKPAEGEAQSVQGASNRAAPSGEMPSLAKKREAGRSKEGESTPSGPRTASRSESGSGQGGGFGGGGSIENGELTAGGGATEREASEEIRRRYGVASRNSGRTSAVRESQTEHNWAMSDGGTSETSNVQRMVQEGRRMLERGKLHTAEQRFNEALKEDPDNKAAAHYSNLVEERAAAVAEDQQRRYGVPPGEERNRLLQKGRRLSYRRPTVTEEREPRYAAFSENPFRSVLQAPLSTFSIDVDTASYSNVRRFLREGRLPPNGAVRIEEMINYFDYDYPAPKGDHPLAVDMEAAEAPWDSSHQVLRVGLRAKEMPESEDRPSNFVFLVDVSGSMSSSDRLPTLKQGLRMFVKQMDPADRVAIVTYANDADRKLPSTSGERKAVILSAIDELDANGSTNGEDGMRLAYETAKEHFLNDGNNRVILCTDGDFNVGTTDKERLLRMIRNRAEERIFLTILGVGTDNYHDSRLLHLADNANGNYYYIDSVEEAYRVLVEEQQATLVTVAKDVKLQIEFNPARVQSYRLIGYEKRQLADEDFNNDRRDAGDVGAGHTVTALYELIPTGSDDRPVVDELKYQPSGPRVADEAEASNELLTLKLRYKHPEERESQRLTFPLEASGASFDEASSDFRFATAVAAFGMNLRDSRYIDDFDLEQVRESAQRATGADPTGARAELIGLIEKARELKEGN